MSLKSAGIVTQTSIPESSELKLSKNFGWLSLLGIAFSLTNSWLGVSSSLVVGISSGGPLLIIYGLIIGVFFTLMCGWSLAEFSSLLPNSSGASFWVLKMLETAEKAKRNGLDPEVLEDASIEDTVDRGTCEISSPERKLELMCTANNGEATSTIQRSTALAVGLINYFGAIFTTSSVFSSLAISILGVHSLLNEEYTLKHWHVFVVYEVLVIFLTLVSCWSLILPALSKFGLGMSLITYMLTFIVSLVCRSSNTEVAWPKPSMIFGEFKNTTGWKSSQMAFIVGLINPLWAFAGIDSATHMVDEVGYTASMKLVPRVIIGTILIGFVTSFTYAIGMFFCITDPAKLSDAVLPILELYYQATGNKNLSVFLQCCCIVSGITCGVASVTWQSRILWSLGRDFSKLELRQTYSKKILKFFGVVNPTLKTPLNAHFFSQLLVAIIGCIFMGSSTAFNAIITACITLLLLSYAIPCLILFMVGRRRFFKRIKKQLTESGISGVSSFAGSRIGAIPNVLTILWTLFCLVFLSFPYTLPVSAGNMNYVSVVYGVVVLVVSMVLFI